MGRRKKQAEAREIMRARRAAGLRFVLVALLLLGAAFYVFAKDRAPDSEARRLVASGALLVDVRTTQEFSAGHIPGAVNIPVHEVESRLGEFGPKDKPIVVYCHSGQRSGRAARLLRNAGFSHIYDLGAMTRW